MIFVPKTGRLVRNNGSNAQCIAQAKEVVTPNASRFIFSFMPGKNNYFASKLQSNYLGFNLHIIYSVKVTFA